MACSSIMAGISSWVRFCCTAAPADLGTSKEMFGGSGVQCTYSTCVSVRNRPAALTSVGPPVHPAQAAELRYAAFECLATRRMRAIDAAVEERVKQTRQHPASEEKGRVTERAFVPWNLYRLDVLTCKSFLFVAYVAPFFVYGFIGTYMCTHNLPVGSAWLPWPLACKPWYLTSLSVTCRMFCAAGPKHMQLQLGWFVLTLDPEVANHSQMHAVSCCPGESSCGT